MMGVLLFLSQLVLLGLYIQVSRIRVPRGWLLGLPVLGFVLAFYLPMVYSLAYPLLLIALSQYWDPHRSWSLHCFYGLYTVFMVSFLRSFLLLGLTSLGASLSFGLDVMVTLLILPFNALLLHLVDVNFASLRTIFDHAYLWEILGLLNLVMLTGYLLLIAEGVWQDFGGGLSQSGLLFSVTSYLLLFLLLLFRLIKTLTQLAEQALLEQKDRQLADLASYSKHVESLYKEIRSFRHDYANILISLKLGIEERDMDMVEQVYEGVLAKSGQKFQEAKYDIGRLIAIKDDAIKSVLSAKLLEAQSLGLNIVLEVAEDISAPNMDLLDFITVLTILCDNAIYEAKETTEKRLTIAYFQEGAAKVLIVENSTRAETINIAQIFEEGYSTKGDNRGIGLANVRRIADSDVKVTIQTSSRNHVFRQTLEMRD